MDVVTVRYMDVRDVEMVPVRHVDMVAVRHVDMRAVAVRSVDVVAVRNVAVRNVCMPSAATTSPLCLGLDLLVLMLYEWMIAVVLHISDERVDQGFPVDRVRVEGISGEHKRQCDDQN